MSKRLLLAAAGAVALSVASMNEGHAAAAQQQCWSKLLASGQKMTAAEWMAYACQGVAHLTDARSLAQIAATKTNVCAGIATDRLVQLLARPEAVASAGGGSTGDVTNDKALAALDNGGGPNCGIDDPGQALGKDPAGGGGSGDDVARCASASAGIVGASGAGAVALSMACGMSSQKMTAAQRMACTCQTVAHLTDVQRLMRIAATKRDACSGVAADRLAELSLPAAVVELAGG
ncbi:MAG: hypothetical protein ACHQK9_25005, partial [Reyranellales bacterium]